MKYKTLELSELGAFLQPNIKFLMRLSHHYFKGPVTIPTIVHLGHKSANVQ